MNRSTDGRGGGVIWRAYLSTISPLVNARDRIGTGFVLLCLLNCTLNETVNAFCLCRRPWFNVMGVKIADDVLSLHSNNGSENLLGANNTLTEKGLRIARHDVLTGSDTFGRAITARTAELSTCADWTSDSANTTMQARLGLVFVGGFVF